VPDAAGNESEDGSEESISQLHSSSEMSSDEEGEEPTFSIEVLRHQKTLTYHFADEINPGVSLCKGAKINLQI